MALLHTDLHDSHVTLALEHQCPTVVRLGVAKGGHLGVAQTRHLRRSGKVLKSVSMCVVCVSMCHSVVCAILERDIDL